MTILPFPRLTGDVVRVRMAERDDAAALVADVVAPTLLQREGWSAHAVEILAAGETSREVVMPAEPAVAGVAPRRLAAYLAGRVCAARALHAAGRDGDAPIAIGEAGAPAWPVGVVGSISHGARRAVAVVAESTRWRALGVDCEEVLSADQADEIAGLTLGEADGVDVVGNGSISWPEFATLGFSAKESLYKCLRPLVGAFFDFADARLTRLDRSANSICLQLTRDLAPGFGCGAEFDAGFALADGHVYTVVALEHRTEGVQ